MPFDQESKAGSFAGRDSVISMYRPADVRSVCSAA